MANEYLKRTPTSTGNRRVFTWAVWLKKNELSTGFGRLFEVGADVGNRSYFTFRDFDELEFVHRDSATNTDQIISDFEFRDPGSFAHFMIAANSTASTDTDRIKIYVNGVLLTGYSTSNFPVINQEFDVNSLVGHYLGNSVNVAGDLQGYMTDLFFVDGQALTPDVFGFYKEGKGYQSSGSTQSTDFRPGQWVPKAPRSIKSEINRRGGFGVNGFYLPMNDSSNFGADFHCAPNSIIKLKGEDLPQPRNGAPTTTDAYVSQLRTDPYAANLVLAVPGISTSTSANLVTNGTFDSDVSNWTAVDATITWSNGRAQTNRTGGSGYTGYQAITVESGKRYTLSGVIDSTGTGLRQDLRILDNLATSGGSLVLNVVGTSGQVVQNSGSFTASQTTYYVYFVSDNSGTGFFDNVVVKQEDAPRDYSADIKGSGSNKTITAGGNAGVAYEIPSYYGSAIFFDGTDDYLTTNTSTDFQLGSSDFTVEAWVKYKSGNGADTPIVLDDTSTTYAPLIGYLNANLGYPHLYLSSTGSSWDIASGVAFGPVVNVDQWTHLAISRQGTNISLYRDGVGVGIITDVGSKSIYQNSNQVSLGFAQSNKYFDGHIQDLRVYKGVAKYKGGFDVPKPYTPVGIESWRAVPDTTANNFCTWNPLSASAGNSDVSFADGNLKLTSTVDSWPMRSATFGISSGKWYFESYAIDTTRFGVGWGSDNNLNTTTFATSNANSYLFWSDNPASKYELGTKTALNGSPAFTIGDITGIAIDFDAGKIWYSINGTWTNDNSGNVGNPSNGSNPQSTFTANIEMYPNAMLNLASYSTNFGQNPTFSGNTTAGTYTDSNGKGLFKYQPPSGFLALCEDNLPTPAIADPGDYFKTVLWTGDGQQGRSIKCGFSPDFVWIKKRAGGTARDSVLFDTVRGSTIQLKSSQTQPESSEVDELLSFDDDGFSVGSGDNPNGNGNTYVAWCWKAGGSSNTFNVDGTGYATASAAGITDGSIALTGASVNTTAGFSIISYTGNGTGGSIAHGLSQEPELVIIKDRDFTFNWIVYSKEYTTNHHIQKLNLSDEQQDAGTVANNDYTFVRGSSTLTVSTGTAINTLDDRYIAYCWHSVENFSKFGSYEGNLDSDGPFVWCGFKPAVVILKWADGSASWVIQDSSRTSTNPSTLALLPDSNSVELSASTLSVDFLSNGFKIRNTNGSYNNASTYIFAAFAESPFQTANAK